MGIRLSAVAVSVSPRHALTLSFWLLGHRFLTSAVWSDVLLSAGLPCCSQTLVAKSDSLASTCEENTDSPQLCISLCLPVSGVHPVCMDSSSPGKLSLQGWRDNSVPPWEEQLPSFFQIALPMTWIGTDNLTQHLRASEEICFQGKHFHVAIYIFRRWKKICAWERKPQGVALSNPLVQQALSGLCQPLETVMSKPSGCKRLPACSGLLTLPGKVSRCCSCPGDEPVPSQWSWCSWTARVSVISAAAFRCRGRVWAGAGCEPWEGVNPTQTLELWCRSCKNSAIRGASCLENNLPTGGSKRETAWGLKKQNRYE